MMIKIFRERSVSPLRSNAVHYEFKEKEIFENK